MTVTHDAIVGGFAAPDGRPRRNVISGNNGGVLIEDGVGIVLRRNLIGTDRAGARALGNVNNGVIISLSLDIQIRQNVISGTREGPGVSTGGGSGASVIDVTGNFIGTDLSGTRRVPNEIGLTIGDVAGTRIGGPRAADRNIISGNATDGIDIGAVSTPSRAAVQGNLIGVSATGRPLGNGRDGIRVSASASAADLTIGGYVLGTGNVIAHNAGAGIVVGPGGLGPDEDELVGTAILRNSIFANGKRDIVLGPENDAPAPNDPLDADTGPNFLTNRPVVRSAVRRAGTTTMVAALDARPGKAYHVELFADTRDASGRVTTRAFLGRRTVTTDSDGHAWFKLATGSVRTGQNIVATATDVELGATSELSEPRQVVLIPSPRRTFRDTAIFA